MATKQERGIDIFQLLKQDHRTVTSLMEEIRNADQQNKEILCQRLESELNQHMDLEEKYVYPVLLDFEEIAELIQDAYSDHDSVKEILEQMSSQEIGSEEWESNFLALEDAKEDHVDMEENDVFPQAEELLSQDQIAGITSQVSAEKQKAPQVQQRGKAAQRQPRAER
jgi:hemerythrin-like domain-containing protein